MGWDDQQQYFNTFRANWAIIDIENDIDDDGIDCIDGIDDVGIWLLYILILFFLWLSLSWLIIFVVELLIIKVKLFGNSRKYYCQWYEIGSKRGIESKNEFLY